MNIPLIPLAFFHCWCFEIAMLKVVHASWYLRTCHKWSSYSCLPETFQGWKKSHELCEWQTAIVRASEGCSVKDSACRCRRCKRRGFHPWARKIPCRRKWQPTPVFLPGKPHGQRSLEGYSPWDRKECNTTKHARTDNDCSLYIQALPKRYNQPSYAGESRHKRETF